MSAIEYGSYYWCVVLSGSDPAAPAESIHLHADEIAVDENGALIFKSKGRRPAGTEPDAAEQKPGPKPPGSGESKAAHSAASPESMIYFALAPGAWKIVYAAKLQDGSAALVEHWNAAPAAPDASLRQNAGAPDYAAVKG
jgi:hypothetical protein